MLFIKCHKHCCNESFGSIDTLQAHYSIKHPTCTYFRCVIETCGRSFDMWNSFRKHLQNKHNVPNRFNECNNVTQVIDLTHSYDSNIPSHINIVRETELLNTSLLNFQTLLEIHANILVSKINTKPGFPRNQVDSVIKDISTFVGGNFLKILKQTVIDTLLTCHVQVENICSIEKMFESLSNPFHHLSTEYKRMMHFQSTGAYISPESYYIDSCIEKKSSKQGVKPQMAQVTAQYIPLRHVLKKFFELPDAFSSTIHTRTSSGITYDL